MSLRVLAPRLSLTEWDLAGSVHHRRRLKKTGRAVLDLHNCMDIQLSGERLMRQLLAMIARLLPSISVRKDGFLCGLLPRLS